jgi:cytochrome c biogenesis protein CcmG/thiol:disulfide interchange protein DsbE
VKRNTVVLGVVLLVLAVFAWAGWANWEYRKQASERVLANSAHADLVAAGSGDAGPYGSPLVGKPAPQFTLEDLSGNMVKLSNFKGKALLINFWATWCGPCKLETPWLVDLRNQYASQGFEILGISTDDIDRSDKKVLDDEKKEISRFVEQMHMPYPVLIEGDLLSKPYGGLDAMPTSFFVDRSGKIVAVQTGITSKDDIASNIRKALGEGI